jgi:hypothetical protein
MRRSRIAAIAAAVLALAVLAPAVQAKAIPGTLDQSVAPRESLYLTDSSSTQTFTAGLTGQLTFVELYCSGDTDTSTALLTISIGTHIAVGQCGPGANWTGFDFTTLSPEPAVQPALAADPPTVTAGQQYTITIDIAVPHRMGVAAANYAGGAAAEGGEPIDGVTDFAFRTYVLGAAATMPPTSAAGSSRSSDGAPPVWLFAAAFACIAGVLITGRRYQSARTR